MNKKHPRYVQLYKAIIMNRRAVRMGALKLDGGPSGLVWVPVNEVDEWKKKYGDQLEMIEE